LPIDLHHRWILKNNIQFLPFIQYLRYLIKTSLVNIYHYHDLINHYIISVSQMTTDTGSKKGRDEYRYSERVSSSYSTCGTPYITLVTNAMMSWMRKGQDCDYIKRNIPCICGHLWHRYYVAVNQVMVVIDINETCFDQIS
jgi:hypothetical protein